METQQRWVIGALGAALLVAVMVAGAVLGAALSGPSSAQAQPGVTGMRQITVIGQGDVRVAPDLATVQLGVQTTAPTTQEALAQNSAQTQAMLDRLRELGVADRDLQTSGISIYPTHDQEARTITGYTVSNTVQVTIREIAQAGTLLDQVVQAGANQVYGISFGLSDSAAVEAQAREAAMRNAQLRAEQLARGGNATLGSVLVISEQIGAGPIMPMPAMMSDKAAGGAMPVEAGEQVVSVQIQVTYELR